MVNITVKTEKGQEIEVLDDYAMLKIHSPKFGDFDIIIDIDDVENVGKYRWAINRFKSQVCEYYTYYIVADTGRLLLHRYIMNAPKGKVVDHIDGNTLNNRKENLRICVMNQNGKNKGENKNNKSGYRGVLWYDYCATPKWEAYIRVNWKRIHIGYFTELEDAIKARKEAEEKYFGEYLRELPTK